MGPSRADVPLSDGVTLVFLREIRYQGEAPIPFYFLRLLAAATKTYFSPRFFLTPCQVAGLAEPQCFDDVHECRIPAPEGFAELRLLVSQNELRVEVNDHEASAPASVLHAEIRPLVSR